MASRKQRLLVGSLGSLVWPAVVVLIPVGITFAAARVYAEGAAPPEACDAGTVTACEDAGEGTACNTCAGGSCACVSRLCNAGQETRNARICTAYQACAAVRPVDDLCGSKAVGEACTNGTITGTCTAASAQCIEDGGLTNLDYRVCTPSSGGTSSGASGTTGFVPGPDKVPGSSGQAVPENNDEGCSTSGSSSLPLLGLPLAIGLLLALRRKKQSRA